MTDTPTTDDVTETTFLDSALATLAPLAPYASYDITADVVAEAVSNAVAAVEPTPVGEHGLAFLVPEGWNLNVQDGRTLSASRLPEYRDLTMPFVGVRSLAAYVNRYASPDTLGYIVDVNGKGAAPLVADLEAAHYVLDDIPVPDAQTARRAHRAKLILRPTAAARRWGGALGKALSQEQMLDLVVEGITEIAAPPGADLRDLISDLHAIRTTSAKSVIRTGGQLAVEVADNVTLHAGPGNRVEVPEKLTLVLAPFAGIASTLQVDVLIKPKVIGETVAFVLTAPTLDQALASIIGEIAGHLTEATGIEPLWVP